MADQLVLHDPLGHISLGLLSLELLDMNKWWNNKKIL